MASKLLDPSWLVGYDFSDLTREEHNGRNVLLVRAQWTSGRVMRGPDIQPTDVEVLIDAQYGFLHQMTAFVGEEPFHLVELHDLEIDPVLDPDVFVIDGSAHVIDEAELSKWLHPSRARRLWLSVTRPFRHPIWRRIRRRWRPGSP